MLLLHVDVLQYYIPPANTRKHIIRLYNVHKRNQKIVLLSCFLAWGFRLNSSEIIRQYFEPPSSLFS